MPLINPAKQLYNSMDIENLDVPAKKPETKGLLAPKKSIMPTSQDDRVNQPAFRVGNHMLLLRKQREMLKDV